MKLLFVLSSALLSLGKFSGSSLSSQPPAKSGSSTTLTYKLIESETPFFLLAFASVVHSNSFSLLLLLRAPILCQSTYVFASKCELSTAVSAWASSSSTATNTYSEINTWGTSQVTDMSSLIQKSLPSTTS